MELQLFLSSDETYDMTRFLNYICNIKKAKGYPYGESKRSTVPKKTRKNCLGAEMFFIQKYQNKREILLGN